MENYNNNNVDDLGYGYDGFSETTNNVFETAKASSDFYGLNFGPVSYGQAVDTAAVIRKSFGFMVIALLITAFAAFTTSPITVIKLVQSDAYWLVVIGEIAIVLISNAALKRNNVVLAGILYTVYSYLTGMLCSIIFLLYTGTSITSVFLITAAMFGAMCVFGFVTKKDLSGFGSICMMGLIGIIIASLVNLFLLRSDGLDFIISLIGVAIFVGLTAYDMQKIKEMAGASDESRENALALFGAFQLYLDFINLFLKLLRLLGKKK